jgi:hypothetical protein
MIDIEKLARESGASRGVVTGLDRWRFSPDELQLFAGKVMLASHPMLCCWRVAPFPNTRARNNEV